MGSTIKQNGLAKKILETEHLDQKCDMVRALCIYMYRCVCVRVVCVCVRG